MSTISLDSRLHAILEDRKGKGTFRSLKKHVTRENSDEPDSTAKIDFSSNDYLSLTRSQQLKRRFLQLVQDTPTPVFGSTGSRLLDGTTPQLAALEGRLCSFFSYGSTSSLLSSTIAPSEESALLFNSGFDANVSFFSTVPQKTDYIIYDELVHASVWDGMRANERRGVPVKRRRAFRHGDVADLKRILEDIVAAENAEQCHASASTSTLTSTSTAQRPGMIFIAIESLYSMDGDLAPLPHMIQALNELQSLHPTSINPARVCVVVDEAHTTGIYGAQGKGFVYDMVHRENARGSSGSRTAEWVQVRLMTFGKGMGSQGAMSVVNVLAIESAFDVIESDEGEKLRQALLTLAETLNKSVSSLLSTLPPDAKRLISALPSPISPYGRNSRDPTPIYPLLTPHPHALALHLQNRGFLVRPVVQPTVPRGQERIRICLHSGNAEKDVRSMVRCIEEWVKGVIGNTVQAKL
ncbi:hypothetical protein QFC22_004345 [Naganishia vaughanmartiniae]|uniref:Uncharacterized protein n=1 Tax=Naganishia vaughanmartiniae TaxID=1424756 RepID=A0ACC2X289_9TREE|nr:hypothetical protein QFC22_004345 [Naganishia vaughanmartiniae]